MSAQAETKKSHTRRAAKVLALTAALVVAGGAAFAWWTTGGSGTGSASTGNVDGITINQTSTITGLYVGGPAVPLAGDFTNTNSGPVRVAQVSVAVTTGWSAQADVSKPPCTAGDFVLTQPSPTGTDVVSGTHVGSWGGASIRLANTAANQDNCKSISVALTYTSN